MKIATLDWLLCCAVVGLMGQFSTAAQDCFTDTQAQGIKAFLHEKFSHANAGMVVGLVDEAGSKIFSEGILDNGAGREVDGDTLFEIGSTTKTFTVLLLQDMVERGEMKLDDPAAQYLPASVRMPAYHGRQITLLNLAAQDSGLPFNADGMSGDNWKARYDAFTVGDMYAFLAAYSLTNEPGAEFRYSNLGFSLLGHVLELKAGTNFEALVVQRICHPLHLDSTRITLGPDQMARAAVGHDETGNRAENYHLQVMAPAGALWSSCRNLLKYVSANLGLAPSKLTPLMEKMLIIHHPTSLEWGKTAMPWVDQGVYCPPGSDFLGHGGGTAGSSTFIGLDMKKRRGVVVLSNQRAIRSFSVGWRILQQAPLSGLKAGAMMPVKEYIGSGIAYGLDPRDHTLRITAVYSNTPAAQAGLPAGLIVQRVNGVPTAGKSLDECVKLGPGGVGAKVRMELVNPERRETNTAIP